MPKRKPIEQGYRDESRYCYELQSSTWTDARLTNMLYTDGETFPKKPAKVYMHNTNLMYPIRPESVNQQSVRETFFYNMLHKDHKTKCGCGKMPFMVNRTYNFKIEESLRLRNNPGLYYAVDKAEIGDENLIPLWLFGFLY